MSSIPIKSSDETVNGSLRDSVIIELDVIAICDGGGLTSNDGENESLVEQVGGERFGLRRVVKRVTLPSEK